MKWPTLKARLANPIMTEEEALRQLKASGIELSDLAKKKLKRYEKSTPKSN
jgi:hypothetical protein